MAVTGTHLKEKGTYLITGGAGGLGLLFADHLVRKYRARLILVGRSELGLEQKQKIGELESLGSPVVYLQANLASRSDVDQVVDRGKSLFGSINGVIHAAGVVRDAFMLKKTADEAEQVFAPKVYGTVNLDEALKEESLDFFALFSSVASVMGNLGQADYAYANRFMDHYAALREDWRRNGERSGKTVSINWPLWEKEGKPITADTEAWLQETVGMTPLDPVAGIEAFEAALSMDTSTVMVMERNERSQSLIETHFSTSDFPSARVVPEKAENEERNVDHLFPAVMDYLKEILSKAAKLPVSRIKGHVPLEKYGIDSLMILNLNQELEQDFGKLSKTLFFEYQTLEELGAYFIQHHADQVKNIGRIALSKTAAEKVEPKEMESTASVPQAVSPKPTEEPDEQEIAIVGLSGRYPMAQTLDEFWENLKAGKDCIVEIPDERWDLATYYDPDKNRPGKTYSKWGGFMDGVDRFDPLFFNISPREAEFMDPQERLFLQTVWHTMEDAGYTRDHLRGSSVGVFVGVMYGQYQLFSRQVDGEAIFGDSFYSSIANRVSYLFDFQGPSIALDTMCSSSLTSIHLACESIRRGECQLAVAGGVNVTIHPNKYTYLSRTQFISSDGRCRSFGEGGDGYVPGEGVGAVLLKPLKQAIADGDQIYAVIKGISINHGGKTNGYSVPNPNAQSRLIRDALMKANVNPRAISYVEAHGTGTSLGDPIEMTGLGKAIGEFTEDRQYCPIGSVKSNIGHLESAAGIAGLTKVLLQMKHKQLVPSIHSSVLNPHIDFEQSSFYVQQTLSEWKKPILLEGETQKEYPRIAGLSSFGAGGSNAHMVLEEYEDQREPVRIAGPQIVVLSARTKERLQVYARNLLTHLEKQQPAPFTLAEVAFTLQTGREAMNERIAFISEEIHDLIAQLRTYCEGTEQVEGVYRGNVKKDSSRLETLLGSEDETSVVQRLIADGEWARLAEIWTYGAEINWMLLYRSKQPRRISLPTYPFRMDRYWIHDHSARLFEAETDVKIVNDPQMHPLLHRNLTTLREGKFLTQFSGSESLLTDHRIGHQSILPGSACLEMVRAAGERSVGKPVRMIRNFRWLRPITVQQGAVTAYTGVQPDRDGAKVEMTTGDDPLKQAVGQLLFTEEEEGLPLDRLDVGEMQRRCPHRKEPKALYETFQRRGIQYGDTFQVVQELYHSRTEAWSLLELPQGASGDLMDCALHPLLMDGAFQTATALLGESVETVYVPYKVGELEMMRPLSERRVFVHAQLAGEDREGKTIHLSLTDEHGEVLVRIRDFVFQPREPSKRDGKEQKGDTVYLSKEWQPSEMRVSALQGGRTGSILLLDQDDRLYQSLHAQLRAEGMEAPALYLVQPGRTFRRLDAYRYEIDITNMEDYEQLLLDLGQRQGVPENIIHYLSRPSAFSPSLEMGFYSLFYLAKALVQNKRVEQQRLLYAYSSRPDESVPPFAGVGGFIRSVVQEHPKLKAKTLRLMADQAVPPPAKLGAVLLAECGAEEGVEVSVDVETGQRQIAGYQVVEPPGKRAEIDQLLKERGVYLITGGMGELGFLFAEHLAKQVKARLVLVGRSSMDERKLAKMKRLEGLGAEVLYTQGDLFRRHEMEQVVRQANERFGRIDGVIHSAGVIRDARLLHKTKEEIDAVLAPKVFGTRVLDEVTRHEPLQFFALFSSLSGAIGNFGQSDYAYANAFMDAFAEQRGLLRQAGRRQGHTLSINWPLWEEGGMSVDEQTRQLMSKTMGTDVLDTASGLAAFADALSLDQHQLLVMKGDQGRIKEKLESAQTTTTELIPTPADGSDADIKEWMIPEIEQELIRMINHVLKIPSTEIEVDEDINQFGFDSVSITEMANAINETYSLEVTPAHLYEYSTVAGLAQRLYEDDQSAFFQYYRDRIHPPESSEPYEESRSESSGHTGQECVLPTQTTHEPVAIVGMSGNMVQSPDLKSFWRQLEAGKDLITEIPADRWDWRAYGGDNEESSATKWGGFMERVDTFDAAFFGISPHEAKLMDPQQRLFLETVWKAIEDAGYDATDLSGTQTGVFVGVSNMDYYELLNEAGEEIEAHIPTGNSHSILPNRLSFLLNLHGPSEPINTACSSSLVAIHKAVEAIRSGQCGMAIAGGVNVIASPRLTIAFDKSGMLSPDGRCKTFDQSANGYVRGEGIGAVLLKPLSQAEADGDPIYAVIRGSAINHCGRTKSLTAPNPQAQAAVIHRAMEEAQVDPREITYLEAHGTGTSLGDPIEINGMKKAFAKWFKQQGKTVSYPTATCGVGSVKTNIGHLESAAGIAGFFKVVLGMQQGKIPKSLHLSELNPYISLKDSPFYLVSETRPWQRLKRDDGTEIPRMAGVSSFGFGGVNAHVIIEEYRRAPVSVSDHLTPQLFVLSAKNEERLRVYAKQMLHYLKSVSSYEADDVAQNAKLSTQVVKEGRKWVADILNVAEEDINIADEWMDYGFDAFTLMELARKVSEMYGIPFHVDHLSQYPSLSQLASYLVQSFPDRLHAFYGLERIKQRPEQHEGEPFSLPDFCYTLQVGRMAMKSRIACVVSHVQELIDKLTQYVEGESEVEGFYRNTSGSWKKGARKEGKETVNTLLRNRQLSPLAELWVAGTEVDWRELHRGGRPQRLSLPTYPFEEKRYWMDTVKTAPPVRSEITGVKALAEDGHIASKHLQASEESNSKVTVQTASAKSVADVRMKVRRILAEVLAIKESEIDEEVPFAELGLDSILGIKMVKKLNQSFAINLNPMKLIQHPTVVQLATSLAEMEGVVDEEPATEERKPPGDPAMEIKDQLKGLLAQILSMEKEEVMEEVPFAELGLDSILGIELVKRINRRFKIHLNPMNIVEQPTITRLAVVIQSHMNA